MLNNLAKRVANRILRFIRDKGFLLPTRQFVKLSANNNKLKLLIVAPGQMAIPPSGWGAVENIIVETQSVFEAVGFEVWLLNSKNIKEWKLATQIEYNIILNHSDQDCLRIKKLFPSIPLVTISHYGFGAFEDSWNKDFKNILKNMEVSDKIICLSEEIKQTFANHVDSSKLLVSPNGSSFSPIIGRDPKGPLVCVGKVEKRKFQYELWQIFKNSSRKIEFIGPISDERVFRELKTDNKIKDVFIGVKNKEFLANNLHFYSGLILPSLGEADALVLYEAQLAGLPIFVTKRGLGSQNSDLKWIHIIPQAPEVSLIEKKLNLNETSAQDIALYSKKNYSWAIRSSVLIDELLRLAKTN